MQLDEKEVTHALPKRATIYCKLDRYKDAIADWTNLIEREPELASGYYGRGVVFQKIGKEKEA